MNMFILFLVLQIINVVLSTVRSLTTIKASPAVAAFVNAGYYAFYTVVLIYTVADFPLWVKCAITFATNLVGVFIVKIIEKKMRKDKLWKVEATIDIKDKDDLDVTLDSVNIPHNYIEIGKHAIFNCYCATQKESSVAKIWLNRYNAKYFVSESEVL